MAETRTIGLAEETRLRILIEQLVREGKSDEAITKAVREATAR
jgi:hypothetical protein